MLLIIVQFSPPASAFVHFFPYYGNNLYFIYLLYCIFFYLYIWTEMDHFFIFFGKIAHLIAFNPHIYPLKPISKRCLD